MKKDAESFEVAVDTDGQIRIKQHEDFCVYFHPDQIEMLIEWLREARRASRESHPETEI